LNPSRLFVSLVHATTLAIAACCIAGAAQADTTKIGFIDTDRILRESSTAKAAEVKLEKEFAGRSKELQDLAGRVKAISDLLAKDSSVLSDAERAKRQAELGELNRTLQRRQRDFQEDLNLRQQEEYQRILETAFRVIKRIAQAEGYDIIFEKAVRYDARIDMTDKVIKALSTEP
jgi:outer membrane protein